MKPRFKLNSTVFHTPTKRLGCVGSVAKSKNGAIYTISTIRELFEAPASELVLLRNPRDLRSPLGSETDEN